MAVRDDGSPEGLEAETVLQQSRGGAAGPPVSGSDHANGERQEHPPAPAERRARPSGNGVDHRYAKRRQSPDRHTYAALDLGTNNCRLLVAEPQYVGFRVVDAFSRIVRLGEGLSARGRLDTAAMSRAIEALKICQLKMTDRNVTRARLIATEACRSAGNGAEFIKRVRGETGIDLEVVDRKTEARLAVAGCSTLIDREAECVVLFDIGGGSSELVFLDFRGGRPRFHGHVTRHIRVWTSLPVGVVTLAERYGGIDVTAEVFEAMVNDVRTLIAGFEGRRLMSRAIARNRVHLLGTSGTVTTIAGIHLGLKRYDRRRVDGTWMERQDVSTMINQLLHMSFDERVANPCIGVDRADLVLAGCAILEAIHREWPCQHLRVADRGLREGILVEMMSEDGVWLRRRRKKHRRWRGNPRREPKNG